jgi:hypothetical protein
LFDLPNVTAGMRIFTLAFSIAMLLVAVTLWYFPLTVARKIVPGPASADYPVLSVEQFQRVGATLLGLWLLTGTLPNIGYYAVAIFANDAHIERSAYASILRLSIELAIGLWLLFGARGIARLVQFARDMGREV